jgi:hypothetical protein
MKFLQVEPLTLRELPFQEYNAVSLTSSSSSYKVTGLGPLRLEESTAAGCEYNNVDLLQYLADTK